MTPSDVHKRILFAALKKEAQPVLGQLRAAGHEVSLVEDLDEAQVLLASGTFDQTVLAASSLASLLEHRLLWESTDTDAWRRSISAIAHDLRSLLLALERSIECLQEDDRRRGGVASEFSEIRHTISTLSSFLQELTVDLGNGVREELNWTSVDLEDVVETAAMAAYPRASERRQKLVIDIDEDVTQVRADSTKLKRVLTGLLQYASRHTTSRGTVKVRAYQEHPDWVISISHTGDALTRSELPGLFSPLSDKGSSAGAGLTRVERLVAQHGGRLWIESEKGSGTSIFVSLPMLADDADNRAAPLTRD